MPQPLSEADRRTLWEQYVDTYVDSQRTFDTSIRALAAGGLAITVSLATALNELERTGTWAAILFLGSLGFNLVSYPTAQRDMRRRLDALSRRNDEAALDGNGWTKMTHGLNFLAGAALIVGGALLARFVSTAT